MTFELKRLGDVAEIVGGGTPSTKQSKFWDGEIPWLTPKDLSSFNGVYVDKGSRSITSDGLRASSAKMLPPGSVLYTSRAPIGYVAIARNSIATNQGFKSFVLKDGFVPEYVFYLLKASKAEIESHASGGTFAEISAKAIADVLLPFPPFEHQRAIANLLSSLDMKLEINRSISKSLESIAQSLFKSWFIDFDPVKAKVSGEAPVGMDSESASLFPDSMVESEIGMIPNGWEVVPSTDMFEILSGGTPKTTNEEYWSGEIPWFSVVDAPNEGGCFFIKTAKTITGEGLKNSAARLVRPGVTVISARGTVGKTAIVAVHSTFNQSCYGIEGKYGDFFTYLLLKNQISRLQSISHGGMFDTITRETFSSVLVSKPSLEIISSFESIVDPIFHEIRNLQFQNQNLSELRDALLPRLISGELQIPEEMLAS
jgi:type I restriction enzyme S subunit